MQLVRLSLCDCGSTSASNLVYTKEIEMAHMRPTPCQIDKWNCQALINIKK